MRRRLPIGAEPFKDGVHFRVWAPKRRAVVVVCEGAGEVELEAEERGYFSGSVRGIGPGERYRFRLDDGDALPDPASRSQPEGPHGPSEVVAPDRFAWTDGAWRGVGTRGHVIYEMHVGTFTPEGTWAAASDRLPELASLGISLIEMMPIHDFPGRFGWGYDGVDLYAPTRLYGTPDDLRRFIDAAHKVELGVILDVVYNHFGPDGNYLAEYADHYFSERDTDWGKAFNFDGEHSEPVREFFVQNAAYWIDEFHFDGLRLDATQSIHDDSEPHLIAELVLHAREVARPRGIFVVGENEPQKARLLRPPEAGGHGLDALWNDDYHHSAVVALTGRREAYYTDYRGSPQELISALKWGFLYQGQFYSWQKQPRGTPALDVGPSSFITFLENHDQLANSLRGERMHQVSGRSLYRAMLTLTLLGPGTPMLFQGQEFASSRPFLYFADHGEKLADLVRRGRLEFLAQFPSLATPECQEIVADPSALETFERCKLDWSELPLHREDHALVRDLIALRKTDPAFSAQDRQAVDGSVLARAAFLLRFFADTGDRLLLVNLGADLALDPAGDPLLAPPEEGRPWTLCFSSEDPRYHGQGTPAVVTDQGWHLPARSAVVLAAAPR